MQESADRDLFCSIQESNLRHGARLREFHARLTGGDLAEAVSAVRSLALAAATATPEGASVRRVEGFDVPPDAARAFVQLAREHPAYRDDEPLRGALPLIGSMPDGPDPTLEGRRGELGELLLLGALAMGVTGPDDRLGETVLHIGVGAGAFSGLLRDVLLGKPVPDLGGLHLPPRDLIDLMEDVGRRTCGLGLAHAVTEWGRAAASNRMEAWADGIGGLSPASGCAGTQVTISGSGFGASQPGDVEVWFARTGGGCTQATQVLSWSDTQISVTAPAGVGPGCVGFVRHPAAAQPMAEAASNLAGLMVECIGPAAMEAARRIETRGSIPILKCPPCLPGNANYFAGGPPKIERFTANGAAPDVTIAPGDKLDLSWSVVNATSVELVRLEVSGQANEHPTVNGPFSPTTGIVSFPSVQGTFSWDREYELRARNACTQPNAPVTRRLTIHMRSVPDLSVVGIEATQAIQFFAANVHMLNPTARRPDGDVALLAGKPTVVRVFVDSGQLASFEGGTVRGVRARLHGRDSSGRPLPGSPLPPLNPAFAPDPNHTITAQRRALVPTVIADERMLPATRSFLFLLPASWTAFGRIDVTAEVLMPSGVPERSMGNNTLAQTLVFNRGGLPLRLAVLRVAFNDPVTGTLIPAPNLFQVLAETDRIQRVYPSNRALLSVVPAPGTNPWFYVGNLAAPGISCGAGFNEIVGELMIRAFFTLGMEDRVWVALLDGTALAPGQTIPASGCGAPMSSLAAAYLSGAILAGILLGPIPALVLARLGVCAVGMAAGLITTSPAGPAGPVGTLEQEIGHAFARFHIAGAGAPPLFEPNWPDYQAGAPFQSIGEFGLEIDDFRGLPPVVRSHSPRVFPAIPVASVDFMSYAPGPNWVSPAIYERLMTGATAPAVQPPAPGPTAFAAGSQGHDHDAQEGEPAHPGEITDPADLREVEPMDVALVRGSVLREATRLFPVYVHRRAIRLRPVGEDETPYRVEFRDERDQVLAGNGILPLAEQHAEAVEPDFLFGVALPWDDRTARIVLLRGGEELAAITVPSEPPRLAPPQVERSEEGLTVMWDAEAPEGVGLRYMVRYATGEERQWQLVAADLAEPRLRIPAEAVGGQGDARIQVGASAGGRTVWEESETFEATPSSPEVVILTPVEGQSVPGHEISFRGEAMTLEDGLLGDESLSWQSSVDGGLGSGRHLRARLSPGEHTIELVARSPLGPERSASVRVMAREEADQEAGP